MFSSMVTKEEFEKTLRSAEALSKEYPGDARILTRWGIILVGCPPDLSRCFGSNKLLQDGIEKLEAALEIDPNKDEALMWLGKAYTTKGLQTPDLDVANECFDKAHECCRKAYKLQPENWEYKLYLDHPSRGRASRIRINEYRLASAAALFPLQSSSSANTKSKENFEKALGWAEALHNKNPLDARNLRRWGVMLLSLSEYHRFDESNKLLEDAIDKLKAALDLDPNEHEALTWLAKTYKSKGLKTPDLDDANEWFDKADECCRRACELQPENIIYACYLKDVAQARKLHPLLNRRGPSESSSTSTSTASIKP